MAAGYLLLWLCSLSGGYEARQKEDTLLATTSHDGDEES